MNVAACYAIDALYTVHPRLGRGLCWVFCRLGDRHDPWCRGRSDHTWSRTKKRTIRQPKGPVTP
jgi:hypothetical protein